MNTIWRSLLFIFYFILTFAVVNLSFPIRKYFVAFYYPRSYVISSFMLLCFILTVLTIIPLRLTKRSNRPLFVRILGATALQFGLVCGFSFVCSGAGFAWSLQGPLERLSFFFMEWEWLRFIFEVGLPLAVCAGLLYLCIARIGGESPDHFETVA